MKTIRRCRTRVSLALAAAIALSLTPIARAQASSSPRSVEIGEFTQPVQVFLRMGDTLRVVLAATPSTGYSWSAAGAGAVLQATGSANAPSAPARPGAEGRQTLSFTAAAAGSGTLRLAYGRPWEKGTPPARQYLVSVTVTDAASEHAPVVIDGSTPRGTYSGTLPCADCSSLLTSIAFYSLDTPQSPDGYYVRTSTYQGSPKGDVVAIDAGHCLFQNGTPDNPKRTVYSLQSNPSGRMESYLLHGDTLMPLGSDGKPIQAPFNLNLTRRP